MEIIEVGKYCTDVYYQQHQFEDGCSLALITQNDQPYVVFAFNFHASGEMKPCPTLGEARVVYERTLEAYAAGLKAPTSP